MNTNLNDNNFHPPALNKYILKLLPINLDNKSILDIGCGLGDWGYMLRTRKTGAFHIDGLDLRQQYLDRIPEGLYNTLWTQNLQETQTLPNYDYIICVQVIEHLDKINGFKLLEEIERNCSTRAIVTTPYGYMRDFHHLSGWYEEDLRRYGYKCARLSYQQLPRTLGVADKLRRFFLRKGTGKLLVGVRDFA